MSAVSASHFHSLEFVSAISRNFHDGRFLIVGGNPEKVQRQFAEAKREAVLVWPPDDLITKLGKREAGARFETAIWFYPSGEHSDERMVKALSHFADNIVLIPGPRH